MPLFPDYIELWNIKPTLYTLWEEWVPTKLTMQSTLRLSYGCICDIFVKSYAIWLSFLSEQFNKNCQDYVYVKLEYLSTI